MKMKKKNPRVTILKSDKMDFKTMAIIKEKNKVLHNEKGINTIRGHNLVNICAPNIEVLTHIKQLLIDIKGKL